MGTLKAWYQTLEKINFSNFLALSDDFCQEAIQQPLEKICLEAALVAGTVRYTQAIWAMNGIDF